MKTLIALFGIVAGLAQAADLLELAATVPLPGVHGRFDHFAVDSHGHRVFVAALANNTLEVIDAQAATRIHSIPGLHKPTGVAYLPAPNQIVVANGDEGSVKIFSGSDYRLVKSISGLDDADNVRFDARANRIYVGYGSGALAAIDAASLAVVSTIKLAAHPESFQLEQAGPRVFVNLPDARHIAVIDRNKAAVIASWPMNPFRANFPMALDEAGHRLMVGCRNPSEVVLVDTASGNITAHLPISGDTDDLFWDAGRQRLYVSCGEGYLDIFTEQSGAFARASRIRTRPGARTCWFDPLNSHLYLAAPDHRAPAELRIYTPASP